MSTPGLAMATPDSADTLASLIADVAEANQKLQDLGAAVQTQQESVNKAIVDVQTARDNAAAAQQEVAASQTAVADANTAITAAQRKFDTFAAATYVNGPSGSYLNATSPDEMIATATAGQVLALSSAEVMANLQRARTEQVNRESMSRLAKKNSDQATVDAQTSQDDAVAALKAAQQTFARQQDQIDQLAVQRDEAKAKLQAARQAAAPSAAATPAAAASGGSQAPAVAGPPSPSADWDRRPASATGAPPYGDVSQWDTTLPMIPSAFVSGDPIQIINAVLNIAATSAQMTADMGRKFLQGLGILPTPTGYTNGAIPRVYGSQAVQYVIQRAMSQLGVPYSWGGGNAAGRTFGIDSGSNTNGFDCSGLVLYAFAGVGIKLPHYSGSQYNMGTKVPSSQARAGDLYFWGPGGSQHVAIALGTDATGKRKMIEAPYTGSVVKISDVRDSGMTPFAVRLIG